MTFQEPSSFDSREDNQIFQTAIASVNRLATFQGASAMEQQFGPLTVNVSPLEKSVNGVHSLELSIPSQELSMVQKVPVGVMNEDGSIHSAGITDMTGKLWLEIPPGKYGLHIVGQVESETDKMVAEKAASTPPLLISDELGKITDVGFLLRIKRADAELNQAEAAVMLSEFRGDSVPTSLIREIEAGSPSLTFSDLSELLHIYESSLNSFLETGEDFQQFQLR